jgi:hypothetical protein
VALFASRAATGSSQSMPIFEYKTTTAATRRLHLELEAVGIHRSGDVVQMPVHFLFGNPQSLRQLPRTQFLLLQERNNLLANGLHLAQDPQFQDPSLLTPVSRLKTQDPRAQIRDLGPWRHAQTSVPAKILNTTSTLTETPSQNPNRLYFAIQQPRTDALFAGPSGPVAPPRRN